MNNATDALSDPMAVAPVTTPVFTTKQVSAALGVPTMTLQSYVTQGLVQHLSKTAQQAPRKKQDGRRYTLNDVCTLNLARQLVDIGVKRPIAFGIAKVCIRALDDSLDRRWVFLSRDAKGWQFQFADGPNAPDRATRHIAISIAAVVEETVEALKYALSREEADRLRAKHWPVNA